MKIVSLGDILLTPEMMNEAIAGFPRYDEVKTFFYGPEDRSGMRAYIKSMERPDGYNCAPLPDEVYRELEDADVFHVHMAPVPEKVFEVGKKLKLVASNRGGTENLHVEAATKAGVPVIHNPAHNANAVAEMTIGMIIAEMRNIGRCHASMTRDKAWREAFPNSGNIHELYGKTVGLIGCGTIARLVIGMLKAFHVRILVTDPFVAPEEIEALGASPVDEETLLRNSDVVSIHTRVAPETIGMMGEKQFSLMKKTAVFINTARPALVDTAAMVRALQEKQIMGAALDVFDVEPIPKDDPLLALDNVTLSCHKGGDTVESFANSPAMILEQAEVLFGGGKPRFLLNPSVLK